MIGRFFENKAIHCIYTDCPETVIEKGSRQKFCFVTSCCHLMQMDLQFCSELELFNGKGLADHMKVHPTCRFCNMALYSKNEEEAHMAEHHFVCQVCLLGGQGTYFSEAVSYRNHLRQAPLTLP